jgi:hypothetical protein
LVVVVAGALPARAAPSNPAFLGIAFDGGRCFVTTVNEGSGAKDAGLHNGDIIIAVDGVPITKCDTQLTAIIVSHQPGDTLRLDVTRGSEHVVANAVLSTRAEVLHRRWVDHPLDAVEARDLDDGRAFDLADLTARTTVLGWFDLRGCTDCAQILRRVASALDGQRPSVRMLALTKGTPEELSSYRKGFSFGAQVATVPDDFFDRAVFSDPQRVHFMVVDCHGVVRFVAPMAADADDNDAALDELVAAVKQAEHARRR